MLLDLRTYGDQIDVIIKEAVNGMKAASYILRIDLRGNLKKHQISFEKLCKTLKLSSKFKAEPQIGERINRLTNKWGRKTPDLKFSAEKCLKNTQFTNNYDN